MRKRSLPFLVLSLVFLLKPSGKLQAQWVVSDPALESTQLAAKAQQVLQYIKEVELVVSAIQMVTMMTREGQNLTTHPSTDVAVDISQLMAILQQSQGLAGDLGQMDTVFRNIYAPYMPSTVVTYADAYAAWANTTLNTIHATGNAAGAQDDMVWNEQAFMAQVQAMNQTDMGQDQLTQLGNAIGTEELSQLQKLRHLMIADMSSKQAFMAQQVNTQQAQQSAQQSAFTHANWMGDGKSW